MARTKRVRRSYSAGEWGRNRVRVFPDPKAQAHPVAESPRLGEGETAGGRVRRRVRRTRDPGQGGRRARAAHAGGAL